MMNDAALKEALIKEIRQSDDNSLLAELYHFLRSSNALDSEYTFAPDEREQIIQAQQQIKDGEYLTNDEANQDISLSQIISSFMK